MKSFFEFKKLIKKILTCTSHVLLALLFFFIAPQYPASDVVQQKHELTHQHTEEEEHDHEHEEEHDHVHAEQIRLEQKSSQENQEYNIDNINNDNGIELTSLSSDIGLEIKDGIVFSNFCPNGSPHKYNSDADTGWKYNQTHHWKECEDCHMGVSETYGEHNFSYEGGEGEYCWECKVTKANVNSYFPCSHSSSLWEALDASGNVVSDGSTQSVLHIKSCNDCYAIIDFHEPNWMPKDAFDFQTNDDGHSCDVGDCNITTITHHSTDDKWESNSDYHYKVCDDCGAKYSATAHDYDKWEEIADGTMHERKCKACDCRQTHSVSGSDMWNSLDSDSIEGNNGHQCKGDGNNECGIQNAHSTSDSEHNWQYYDSSSGNGNESDKDKHWLVCDVCGDKYGAVEHQFDGTWQSDSYGNHYRECIVCHYHDTHEPSSSGSESLDKDNISENEGHKCTGADGTCTLSIPHTSSSDVWSHADSSSDTNADYHWYVCEFCGDEYGAQGHNFGDEWSGDENDHYQKCLDCDYENHCTNNSKFVDTGLGTHSCSVCGWVSSEHTPGSDYTYDDSSGHYQQCQYCSARINSSPEEHVFEWFLEGNNHIYKCTTCGYIDESKTHAKDYGWEKNHLGITENGWYVDGTTHRKDCGYVEGDVECTLEESHSVDNTTASWEPIYNGSVKEENCDTQHHRCKFCDIVENHSTPTKYDRVDDKEHRTTCAICNGTYREKHTTLQHKTGEHTSEENHTVVCDICGGNVFEEKHVFEYTRTEINHRGKCKYCNRQSSQASHTYNKWSANNKEGFGYDEAQHWAICDTCGYENKTSSYIENHIWGSDGTCTKCGYKSAHVHSYVDWIVNGENGNHEHKCSCGAVEESTIHNPDKKTNNSGWSYLNEEQHQCTYVTCDIKNQHSNAEKELSYEEGGLTHYYICDGCAYHYGTEAHTPNKDDHNGYYSYPTEGSGGYHYKICKDCGATFEKSLGHTYEPNTYSHNENEHWQVCTECGYDSTHMKHESSVDSSWHYDSPEPTYDNQHYQICDICKGNWNYQNHSFNWSFDDDNHYQRCGTCNYEAINQAHTWEDNWTTTTDEHYKKCTNPECGAKSSNGLHQYQYKTDDPTQHWRYCLDCSYIDENSKENHTYGDTWISDGTTGHYQQCQNSNCQYKTETTPHIFNNNKWELVEGQHRHICDNNGCGYYDKSHEPFASTKKYETYNEQYHQCAVDDCNLFEAHHWGENFEYVEGDIEYHYHLCSSCHEKQESTKETHSLAWNTLSSGDHQGTCGSCTYHKEHAPIWDAIDNSEKHQCTELGCGIPAANHDYDETEWSYDTEHHYNVCTICGANLNITSHSFSGWEVIVDDGNKSHRGACTCGAVSRHAEGGFKYLDETRHQCDVDGCGFFDSHSYSEWHNDIDSGIHYRECTCIQAGGSGHYRQSHTPNFQKFNSSQHKCAGSEDGQDDCSIVEDHDHLDQKGSYNNGYYADETGHYYKCSVCGEKVDVANHVIDWTYEGNKHTATCSVCGFNAEHTIGDPWKLVDSGDGEHHKCNYPGCGFVESHTKTEETLDVGDDTNHWYICSVCHVTFGVSPHNYGTENKGTAKNAGWTADETNHWQECIDCGYKFHNMGPHNFTSWEKQENGTYIQTCEDCGYTVEHKEHIGEWHISEDKLRHERTCLVCEEYESHEINGVGWEKVDNSTHKCNGANGTCTITEGHDGYDTWLEKDYDGTLKHYHLCTKCGEYDIGEHTPDIEENNGWHSDDKDHYHICATCKNEYGRVEHDYTDVAWKNHSRTCNDCGYVDSHDPHWVDAGDNENHKCDICDATDKHTLVWVSNEDGHYQKCSVEGCTYTTGAPEDHEFTIWHEIDGKHVGTCKICNYQQTEGHTPDWVSDGTGLGQSHHCNVPNCTIEGNHEPSSDWKDDGKNHYHECNVCHAHLDEEEHSSTTDTWLSDGTNHYKLCDVCGAKFENGKHDYSKGQYNYDETNHWLICDGCGLSGEKVAHDNLSWETNGNENNSKHWQNCATCHATHLNEATHTYGEWVDDYNPSETHTHTRECVICKLDDAKQSHTEHFEPSEQDPKSHVCTDPNCNIKQGHDGYDTWLQKEEDGKLVHYHQCTICGTEYDKHTSSYTDHYGYDIDSHWLICDECGYENKDGDHKTAHHSSGTYIDGGKDVGHYKVCDDCGQRFDITPHDFFEKKYTQDGTYHYQVCKYCGVVTSTAEAHDFSREGNPNNWYYNDTYHYHQCSICGFIKDQARHTFTGEHNGYTVVGNQHYRSCTCGYESLHEDHISDLGEGQWHISDSEHYKICKVCGVKFENSEHNWGSSWISAGSEGHYQECSVCHADSEKISHNFGDGKFTDDGGIHKRTCTEQGCGYVDSHFGSFKEDVGKGTHTCQYAECDINGVHTSSHLVTNSSDDVEHGVGHHKVCDYCNAEFEFTKHTFKEGEYQFNNLAHWQVCECGQESEHVLHTPDDTGWYVEGDNHHQVCDTCKQQFNVGEHTYELNKYGYKGEEHWRICDLCGAEGAHEGHSSTRSYEHDETNHWKICDACGEKINVDGHSESYLQSADGHYKFCTVCQSTIAKMQVHDYTGVAWENHSRTCTKCGYVDSHFASWGSDADRHWCTLCIGKEPEEHTFDIWVSDETGHHQKCSICEYEEKTHASHKFTIWHEIDGKHVGTCEDCSYQQTEGHNPHWVSDGTGLEQGHHCDVSECTIKGAHEPSSDWKDDGTNHYHECSVCHERLDEAAHSYKKDVYSSNKEEHWQVCEVCGKESTHEEHSYKGTENEGWNYNVETEKHERTCSTCGYSESHLPNLGELEGDDEHHQCKDCVLQEGHSYHWVDDKDNENHHEECSVCGHRSGRTENHNLTYAEVNGRHIGTCECGYQDEGHDPVWNDNKNGKHICETCKLESPHVWEETWRYDDEYHYHKCVFCDATKDKTDENKHVIKWQVVDGEHVGTCTVEGCEYRTASHPGNWKDSNDGKNHQCQDCTLTEEHKWGAWEKFGEKGHQRSCSVEGCTATQQHDGTSNWKINDGKHECTIDGCDFVEEHHSETWLVDGEHNQHYKKCDICGAEFAKEGHTQDTTENNGWHTDDKDNHYHYCSVCKSNYDVGDHSYQKDVYSSDKDGHWQVCEVCGKETEHVEHGSFTSWTTNTETGLHYRTCTTCNYNDAHIAKWENDSENNQHKCTVSDCDIKQNHDLIWVNEEESGHYQKCSVEGCNYTTNRSETHNFKWNTIDGKHVGQCEQCGYRIEHTPSWTNDEGSGKHKCTDESGCNIVEEHKWGEWKVVEGQHVQECTVEGCTATNSHAIPGDDGWTYINESTHKCSQCTITEGHNGSNTWESNDTEHYHHCSLCNENYDNSKSHTYKYEHDENHHWQVCEVCGKQTKPEDHTYSNDALKGWALNEKTGLHERTCQVEGCGYVDSHLGNWKDSNDGKNHQCQDCTLTEEHKWGAWEKFGEKGHQRSCIVEGCTAIQQHEGTDSSKWEKATDQHRCLEDGCDFVEDHILDGHGWYNDKDSGHYHKCAICGTEFDRAAHTQDTTENNGWHTDDPNGHYYQCATCGEHYGQQKHQFNSKYDHDENHHWLVCDICGAKQTGVAEQEHSSDVWISDGKNHYKICVCGQKIEEGVHDSEDQPYITTEEEHYKLCKVCGLVDGSTRKNHNYGDGTPWHYDDNKTTHYHLCADCGYRSDVTEHSSIDGAWIDDVEKGQHYQVCQICGARFNYGEHSYGDTWISDGLEGHHQKCSLCGHDNEKTSHSSSTWQHDEHNHYQLCDKCGQKFNESAHTYDAEGYTINERTGAHERTCTQVGCGYVDSHFASFKEDIGKNTHTCQYEDCNIYEEHSSESYIIDGADGHHKVCDVCGARFNDGAHNFGDTFIQEKDPSLGHHQRCSVCGYETPTEGHNFETPYTKESDKALGHYYKCKDCGYETERVNHNFGDTYYQDGENNKHYQICEDCEYRTPSEEHRNHYESNDKGHWLVCDVCGKSTRDEGGEDKGILSHEAKTKGDGSLEYYDDGTNHWLVCKDCGAVFNKEAHTPKVGWQSNESEHYQVCSICGFIIESSRETHSYELDKWVSTDKTYHWQECTKCGYKHNYGVHNFVPEGHDDDGYIQRCEDCGYVTHHEAHIGEWKVSADGTMHERDCIICGFHEEHSIEETTWSPVDDGMHKCDQCTITASHEGADLTTWFNSADGSYHYHKCYKCGEFDKGNHTYEKGIYESNSGEGTHSPVCDVCGMKKQGESSEHESSEWIVDNELHQHYKKCDKCGAEFERNDHTPDKGESGLTNNYYATEENHYHICEVCGATYGSKAHNYEGVEWSKDGTNHWKVCKECGYKGELSGHSLEWKETEDQTKHYQECSICGYKTEEVEHTSDGYIMDLVKNQHYKVCKECGIEFARGSHTYDDTWKYNDETHWKECTVCQYKDQLRSHSATEYVISGEEHHQVCSCGKEINRSEHHYNTYQYEENGEVHWKVCDECGHKETGSETSHHSSRGYNLDETGNYHYQVCDDCHAQFNKGEHQFSNKYIEYGEFHYQVCDVCNRAIESTKEEHSYKLDWQVEENIHFHACVKCGHRIDIGSHSSSSWKDAGDGHHYQVCEFCGTRFNENQEHVFNGKYDHDTHDHWEVCDLCGAEKAGSRTSHNYTSTYDSENHYEICDTCGDIINKSAHSFEKHFNNEEHWWSCSCGYEKDRASHDEVTWSSDGTSHWKECNTCKEKYSNETHTYGEWQDDLNPEAPHEHTRECEICHTEASRQSHKENYVDSGDGLTHVCSYVGCNIKQGHDGSSTWLSDKEGNHYHECSICGAHYDVEKHSYPKDVYSSDKDGHYQVCEVCGKESTHVEHDSFTSWTINTETGIHYRTCTTCGYNDTHIAQWENDVAVAKHKCTVSGCNIVENHDLIWVNDEELGHHQECSVCDYETSISDEHHFIWATVNGEHYGQCECGYIIHHAPIWQNKDHEHHICEVCGLEESHQWSLWEVDGNHHVRTCLVDGCEATDSHEIHWERVDDASHRCVGKDCTIVEGHDNSITFEFDDTYHYHVCSKCGEYDKEAHVFKDTYKYDSTHHYKICEVCGYASKEKEAHSSKDLIYHIDGNKHYQVCDICGARFNEGEHIFTSIYGHDENGHYLLCEVCGMASETKLNHTYGEWLKEDNKHIHLCTTCGYIEEHEASYESNENEHYCVVDGCTIHEEHDFENNTCKVCNYQRRGISLGNDLSIPIVILGLQIILLGILIIMVIRRKDEGGDEE